MPLLFLVCVLPAPHRRSIVVVRVPSLGYSSCSKIVLLTFSNLAHRIANVSRAFSVFRFKSQTLSVRLAYARLLSILDFLQNPKVFARDIEKFALRLPRRMTLVLLPNCAFLRAGTGGTYSCRVPVCHVDPTLCCPLVLYHQGPARTA